MNDAVEIVFDPHVQTAIICLLVALMIAVGLGTSMLLDWMDDGT